MLDIIWYCCVYLINIFYVQYSVFIYYINKQIKIYCKGIKLFHRYYFIIIYSIQFWVLVTYSSRRMKKKILHYREFRINEKHKHSAMTLGNMTVLRAFWLMFISFPNYLQDAGFEKPNIFLWNIKFK